MEDMMMAFMDSLPVGYRFHPTDEEILCHYLKRKNLGLDEPVCVIPEVDLYRWEPEELRGKFTESSSVRSKDPELWFFCEQKPGRTQPRSTKRGYWKKTGQPRAMKSRYNTKQVIGSRNILTFFRGNNSSSTKTDWVMHEFHLPSNALDGLHHGNRKNYIVCMIKCNSDEMANSPPSDEIEQDEPITMDITNIFDQEADDGLIPEDLVQARMQSLAQDCRTPDDCGNLNFQPILSQFLEHSNSSSESSRTQFLFGGDSIETTQPLRQTQACWTSDDRGNLNLQPILSQFFEHSSSSPESSRRQFSFGRDSIETNQPFHRTQACWTSDDRGNLNFQPILSQFLEHSNSSPESSRTQFSFGRDSIEMDSSFSDIGDIDILADFLHQVLVDQDEHPQCPTELELEPFTRLDSIVLRSEVFDDLSVFFLVLRDNFYETPRHHQQNVVIMENKQTQKVESLPTYLPIHEKKGVSLRFQDYQEQPAPLPSTTPSARQSNAAEPEEEEEFALMWRHTPIEDAFAQGVRAIVAAEAKKAKPLPVHRAGQDWTDESDDESDCPTVIIVTSDDQMVLHNDSSDDSLEYPTISCPPHDDSLPELELSPQVEGEGTPETPETVEDNSAQPAASSLRMDTHRVRCKKESRKVVLQASSEAVAVKQAPLKIKEEMVSATSSSASIRKPRAPLTATPVERRPAAATTKKKEINPMAALSGHGKPARELKPITTTKEPISHSSTCTSRKRSCSNQSMVYFQNTLVGVILLIVIFCEIFNPTF